MQANIARISQLLALALEAERMLRHFLKRQKEIELYSKLAETELGIRVAANLYAEGIGLSGGRCMRYRLEAQELWLKVWHELN